MSIDRKILEALSSGRLIRFQMEYPSDSQERRLFLHPTLAKEIADRAEDWGKRVGRLEADFENFARGQHIALSLTPYKHRSAYMGLLDPPTDGTWEIRSRDPNPGLRVFGKFPCIDTFVALNWEPRSVPFGGKKELGDGRSLQYQLAMIEANQRWASSLPDLKPLTGDNAGEYVSKNFSQV